jgi:acetyl-CoA acetyltransferase
MKHPGFKKVAAGIAAKQGVSIDAARAIQVGDEDLMIAAGVENMTRGPFVLSKSTSAFGRDQQLYDSSFGWRFINPKMKEQFATMSGMTESMNELTTETEETVLNEVSEDTTEPIGSVQGE